VHFIPEARKIPILMYHSIADDASPKFKSFAVSPSLFADQMAYLQQHDYTPINVTQLVHTYMQKKTLLPARPIVITFDDGFADFFTHALPVLQQYNFTATLYITTAFVNGTSKWLESEGEAMRRLLTWSQIHEINAAGIECGAHSHTHPQLDVLDLAKMREEVVSCKKVLEDHLQEEVSSFAYPYGYYTTAVKQAVQEAGYTSACAVKFTLSSEKTDPFALARLKVSSDTSVKLLGELLTTGPGAMTALMLRARTPAWQLVRRSSILMSRYAVQKH